jgi:teichoic acid glycerol-phosphate primase
MFREIAISCYLLIFRILFSTFKLIPQKEKTVFVASFGDNAFYVANELIKFNKNIVILKTRSCKISFEKLKQPNISIITFTAANPLNFVRSIYHLATSKVIFFDNYFGFLSVTKFKENVICVQLWHAAGAIKQFGLMDPSIKIRGKRAIKRFLSVYKSFQYVVVGSEKMVNIFCKSFNLNNHNMLRTGIPRTDFFYQKDKHQEIIGDLRIKYPFIKNKKVILYAPTFRDHELNAFQLALDIPLMEKELGQDYVLLLKLHPSITTSMSIDNSNFVFNVSDFHNINYLLLITDLLITDYSSIPFEFSLLEKPMIFFTYDLEEYSKSRGFWEDFHSNVPGPIAKNTEEVIQLIKENRFDLDKIRNFATEWNKYSRGNSSKNLVKYIYKV